MSDEYSFDLELPEGAGREEVLRVVARACVSLTDEGRSMCLDVEEDEEEGGALAVVVSRDDERALADEDGELTEDSILFTAEGDLLSVVVVSDDAVRVQLLKSDLEVAISELE